MAFRTAAGVGGSGNHRVPFMAIGSFERAVIFVRKVGGAEAAVPGSPRLAAMAAAAVQLCRAAPCLAAGHVLVDRHLLAVAVAVNIGAYAGCGNILGAAAGLHSRIILVAIHMARGIGNNSVTRQRNGLGMAFGTQEVVALAECRVIVHVRAMLSCIENGRCWRYC